MCEDGQCTCDRLYSGDFCQFKGISVNQYCIDGLFSLSLFTDDCIDESDCNNHGSCIDVKSIKFPQKQCFCNAGWFGRLCEEGINIDNQ